MKPQQLRQGKTFKELNRIFLKSISIDLTERCTLRCKYCFADHCFDNHEEKQIDSSKDLTAEMGKQIIDWFLRDDISGPAPEKHTYENQLTIEWWGGEPLLKFELMQELIIYAEKQAEKCGKRITFGGTTNVTLLDEDKLLWLLPRDIHFLLSVDGIGERNNQRLFPNGSSSWETIEKNLKTIVEVYQRFQKPVVGLRMTPSPGNLKGMADDIRKLYNMGFHSIFFSENYDTPWSDEDLEEYRKELMAIADFRIELFKDGKDPLKSKFLDDMTIFLLNGAINGNYRPVNADGRSCGAGQHFMGVSVEGAIYICHRTNKHNTLENDWHEKHFNVGSIFENITNKELLQTLDNCKIPHFLGDQSPMPQCKDCTLGLLCLGGCFAAKYDHDGTITNTIDDLICKIKFIFYDVIIYEIMNAIKEKIFSHYCGAVNIKGFFASQFGSLQAINCACNMSMYNSLPDMLEEFIRREQYHPDSTEEQKQNLMLLATIRMIIDHEVLEITNAQDMVSCICNNGAYSRDNLLKIFKFTNEQKIDLIKMFALYWENK